jgi:hypothetical protein
MNYINWVERVWQAISHWSIGSKRREFTVENIAQQLGLVANSWSQDLKEKHVWDAISDALDTLEELGFTRVEAAYLGPQRTYALTIEGRDSRGKNVADYARNQVRSRTLDEPAAGFLRTAVQLAQQVDGEIVSLRKVTATEVFKALNWPVTIHVPREKTEIVEILEEFGLIKDLQKSSSMGPMIGPDYPFKPSYQAFLWAHPASVPTASLAPLPSGRPRYAEDEWAREQVLELGRARQSVYPEWLARLDTGRRKSLADPQDTFGKLFRRARKKPEKTD